MPTISTKKPLTVLLDTEQFETIINTATSLNFSDTAIQFFMIVAGGFIGSFSAYLFQLRFDRLRLREKTTHEIYKYNEAVYFLSVLTEDIVCTLEQLVLPKLESENIFYSSLIIPNKDTQKTEKFTFFAIPAIRELSEKNLIEKIPDLGKHFELGQVFYRAKSTIEEFNSVCENRNSLIKDFIENNIKWPADYRSYRIAEIIQRTELLLYHGGVALDQIIFITKKINEITLEERKKIKKKSLKIKVAEIAHNKLYDELNDRIINILNQIPEYKNRMIYRKSP